VSLPYGRPARPHEQEEDFTRVDDTQYAAPLATAPHYKLVTHIVLPYERIDSAALQGAVRLWGGEHLLVLQPFGWHLDGRHIPNAAEQFSREGVCEEHGWRVVAEFGPYVAIVVDDEPPAIDAVAGAGTVL
jgi:hypothetical protein